MKLFILGWDNALVSDVVKTKIHPAYMAALSATAPVFAKRWTFKDSVRMQGQQTALIWESFDLLLGKENGRRAKEIFYETYRSFPAPEPVKNAVELLRHFKKIGGHTVVVSNKSRDLLEQEAKACGMSDFVDEFIGSSAEFCGKMEKSIADNRFYSRIALLREAMKSFPNAEAALVVASSGYARAAYALGLPYEEASPAIFDWLLTREKAPEPSVSHAKDGDFYDLWDDTL